ncbi:MAG: DUF2892 domain-containing protein [Spirochaetales bacterium]|nr:DUF2892 domain-containing protein [Spirochaetales bacterium]
MNLNMGLIDRIIRVVIAVTIGILIVLQQVTGVAAIILGVIAGIFLLTSIVGTCPLYLPFGLSTKKKASEGK